MQKTKINLHGFFMLFTEKPEFNSIPILEIYVENSKYKSFLVIAFQQKSIF